MKKFLAAIAMAVFSVSASAQIWVGGSVGLGYTETTADNTTTKTTITTFAPKFGYDLNEKIGLGLEMSVSVNNKETESDYYNGDVFKYTSKSTTDTNAFGFYPFVRYTFLNLGKVGLFVDGMVGYSASKSEREEGSTVTKTESEVVSLSVRPGVKFEVNKHIELESHLGSFGYTHTSNEYQKKETSKTDHIGLNLNAITLNLGLIWKF